MGLKPGDLVILNAVWGRTGITNGEFEGDACIILELYNGYPGLWRVLHGPSGQASVFHQEYFDRLEGA